MTHFAKLGFLVLVFSMISTAAEATFTMTVTPDRGGRDVRFTSGKVGENVRNEEVTITVTDDESRRYRVSLRQMMPFVNAQGQILPPGTVKMFSPSSVRGDLNIVFPEALNTGTTILYTSDSSGTSDSFKLVFGVELQPGTLAGLYQTQLVYQLDAVDGGASTVTEVMNVYVQVKSDFGLSVATEIGGQILQLGKMRRPRQVGNKALRILVPGALGNSYRIFCQLKEPLTNEEGNRIDGENIRFVLSDAAKGEVISGEQTLSTSRILLYESDARGSEAEFTMDFLADDLKTELAGLYTGMLEFFVESAGLTQPIAPSQIRVRLRIETVFYLDVEYDSTGGLHFGSMASTGDVESRHVTIKANNNTGDAYQIIQNISRPFTNERGNTIDFQHLTGQMLTSEANAQIISTSGQIHLGAPTPLRAGETVIYTSDSDGSPTEFVLKYELTIPRNLAGGTYTSDTTYTLTAR